MLIQKNRCCKIRKQIIDDYKKSESIIQAAYFENGRKNEIMQFFKVNYNQELKPISSLKVENFQSALDGQKNMFSNSCFW